MAYRIYIDESGTHSNQWFIVGALFVPDHASLHNALIHEKKVRNYYNQSKKRSSTYKELHLKEFRSQRDVEVGKAWIDVFVKSSSFFRAIVVDWRLYDGNYFGNAFEPRALKRRRAYKKWLEMLLHPEFKEPTSGEIVEAELYLDKLRVVYGYDLLGQLEYRFTRNYEGNRPYIKKFQYTASWKDANQALQLCDLLTGCLYQSLVPSSNKYKITVRGYLETALRPFNVRSLDAGFWRGYDKSSLRKHLPKYSAWFWKPDRKAKKKKRHR